MADELGRTVLRRQLGKELKRLREAAGKTTIEAGAYAGIKGGTVSKIENGKQGIRVANVRLLCQFYGVSDQITEGLLVRAVEAEKPGRLDSYADTMPDWFARFVGLEEDASVIAEYESEVLPGLLQTADYIKALRRAVEPSSTADDLRRSVAFRQARQERLSSPRPPLLHCVINEGALHREVGGKDVMREQLRHLAEVGKRPNVHLQVLPFESGAHPAMTAPFIMLRFEAADDLDLVYLEHDLGGTYLEKPPQVKRYEVIFGQLTKTALSRAKSAELIARVAEQI
ncbi:helix-turn-helix domain-containing protein [Goodfellowiella coeruleoviolacea]|uniref:Helix-turn-helix domain-containing protein n=1 Tax=Goodfellowiella coeruleoviolacea TaxID=334858 RepID=A0AAE3GN77_9PSEU|nr:helix-turn-helix transcriptional regulator [Goodfellowiella coeruleoviolacea]MCP2170349.1 Helix-turn-helix domain-containing protein [Goodfellowiella coeruleoviolacea]